MRNDYSKYQDYWQIISETTGYDFSGYSISSLNQKLEKFISYERIGSAEELRDKIYTDRLSQEMLLGKLLTNNTEFFRDANFFRSLRDKVLIHLATHPEINIWIAGCSTGEEAYSVAILLDELKLLNRCQIVATDINQTNIEIADRGIYSLQKAKACSMRYFKAGGTQKFSNYYTAYYDQVVFQERLHSQITFMQHDLTSDPSLRRFHLVLCRNVLFYLNEFNQRRVTKAIADNIYSYGYLCFGTSEVVALSDDMDLNAVDRKNNIFRKEI